MQDMREADLEPHVVTYNALLGACANGTAWEPALGVLRLSERDKWGQH